MMGESTLVAQRVPTALEAKREFDAVRLKFAELTGRGKELRERQSQLVRDVSLAKARQELAPKVADIFDKMRERAHQKSVGVFEKLLTAIAKDVFPEKGPVKLELGIERGAPSLEILVDVTEYEPLTVEGVVVEGMFKAAEPEYEDVLEDSGGAITNVISAGLRYAALSRTKNRPLIVLDEADCWIKPDRVAAFNKVITDVAQSTQIQTLLISHHGPEFFEENVNIIRLERDENGKNVAVALEPRTPGWQNESDRGLRWIELINIKRHEHTLIHLNPGTNALIGENDFGKSTIYNAALRALAYGQMRDTLIRRGQPQGTVRVGLEEGWVLEMTRVRKGSPKVMYRAYKVGVEKPIHEEKQEKINSVPSFITKLLGVSRVDGLDIQLGKQKKPVFLLDRAPSVRAQLLSVGRESGFLTFMMEKHRNWLARDNKTVRDGETELVQLGRRISAIDELAGVGALLGMLATSLDEVEGVERNAQALTLLRDKYERLIQADGKFSKALRILEKLPTLPLLPEVSNLLRCVERLERLERISSIKWPESLPDIPVLPEVEPVILVGRKLAELLKLSEFQSRLPDSLPSIPELGDSKLPQLQRTITTLERLEREERIQDKALRELQAQVESASFEMEMLKVDMGDICPVCDSPLGTHEH